MTPHDALFTFTFGDHGGAEGELDLWAERIFSSASLDHVFR